MTQHRRTTTLGTYADAVLNDALTTAALIEPALEALDNGRNGYPNHTTGANPAGTPTTTPNDNTDPFHDPADQDQRTMLKNLKAAQKHLRVVTLIAQKWATPTLDHTQIQQRLTAIDERIWCTNHIKHGMQEPRRDGDLCTYCATFHKTRGRLPPVEVLDHRARNRNRISETHTIMLLAKAAVREADERRSRRPRRPTRINAA